jgi:F420-non-reducing hydrogenase small subunit
MSPANGKPTFAMYWAAGCGGCEIAVVNLHEQLLAVDENFTVVFWPVAMDAKYRDLAALPDGAIDLCLFDGGIRNSENAEIARLLRRKSQILVAFGACAMQGGIPALANLGSAAELLDTAFDGPTTDAPVNGGPQPRWDAPEGELRLPELEPRVRTLAEVVPVDYSLPGCPPETQQIAAVLDLVIRALHGEAELPPRGSVLGAGSSTACDECPRTRSEKTIDRFVRLQHVIPDPQRCLLEQGILCSGPATRSGCGALCPRAGMPCGGCYGPAPGVRDQGARLLSAVASVIAADEPEAIGRILDGIPDPAGTFYRFGLAGSLLRGRRPGA